MSSKMTSEELIEARLEGLLFFTEEQLRYIRVLRLGDLTLLQIIAIAHGAGTPSGTVADNVYQIMESLTGLRHVKDEYMNWPFKDGFYVRSNLDMSRTGTRYRVAYQPNETEQKWMQAHSGLPFPHEDCAQYWLKSEYRTPIAPSKEE